MRPPLTRSQHLRMLAVLAALAAVCALATAARAWGQPPPPRAAVLLARQAQAAARVRSYHLMQCVLVPEYGWACPLPAPRR